ncbi:DUF1178 family protein [Pararhodospirillum oryzae]|uniref:Uncharacterized protein n=1 Tax=Pararhodospirillum oryzae TaxID=478448 RepID=A0A512HAK9_9PROT|nr:DUF1178 family protein [Pararhodospirillum oryzae]GEO82493.1 hypothetical protein ROR02_26240 [Pararhodospirillum oryzae]
MIRYALECAEGHVFEHWFDNMADADAQLALGSIPCPECASTEVRKSLMAPRIGQGKATAPLPSCAGPSCCAGACPAMAG